MLYNKRRDTTAAVAPMVAVMMVPMCAVVALALDGGMMMDYRRAVQAAADEAALSAAIELYTSYKSDQGNDGGGQAKQSARTTAAANGFTSSNSTIQVKTANQTALYGRFAGTALPKGHVEVTIDYTMKKGFSGIFGSAELNIRGHAVARGEWIPVKNGVIALKPSGDATLKANGNGLIQIKDGDVIVNSNGSAAGTTAGGNAIVSTEGTYITGGSSGGGFQPTPVTGVAPTPDPLAYLPTPTQPTTNGTIKNAGKDPVTGQPVVELTPGYYKNAFKETQAVVKLAPGEYYFEKGFDISGQAGLQGEGVMIYNNGTGTSEGINITGTGAVSISPPTSGTYKGITFFQNRASTSPIKVVGNGGYDVNGTIYGASANADISGNGDLSVAGQVIVGTLNVGGNGQTVIDFNAPDAPNARLIQLIE